MVLKLSGRLETGDVAEIQRLCERHRPNGDLVLDLEEVKLVDKGVVQFLERCEAEGARLRKCPPYIREWIAQEHDRRG